MRHPLRASLLPSRDEGTRAGGRLGGRGRGALGRRSSPWAAGTRLTGNSSEGKENRREGGKPRPSCAGGRRPLLGFMYSCESKCGAQSRGGRVGCHGREDHGAERANERAANMPLSGSNVRQPSCSRKLCRNLFGPVDHEQFQKDFQSLMRAQLEEAQQKWNFDFETETPLEGKYKWEKVSHLNQLQSQDLLSPANSCAVEKRASPIHLKKLAKTESPVQVGLEACKAGSPRSLKRKQTSMKDFYSSKRRTAPYKPKP